MLIAGRHIWQKISNPHHARAASFFGENLKRRIVVCEASTLGRPDESPSLVVNSNNRFPQHHPIAERDDPRPRLDPRIGHEPRHQSSVQGTNIPNSRPDIIGRALVTICLQMDATVAPAIIE
jgi:hypothetical protein